MLVHHIRAYAPLHRGVSLIGKEVIFVFRMEKLAGSLGLSLMVSAAAQADRRPPEDTDPVVGG